MESQDLHLNPTSAAILGLLRQSGPLNANALAETAKARAKREKKRESNVDGMLRDLSELKVGSKCLLRRKGLEEPTVEAVARTTPSTTPFAEVTWSQARIQGMPLSPLNMRGLTVEISSSHPRFPLL